MCQKITVKACETAPRGALSYPTTPTSPSFTIIYLYVRGQLPIEQMREEREEGKDCRWKLRRWLRGERKRGILSQMKAQISRLSELVHHWTDCMKRISYNETRALESITHSTILSGAICRTSCCPQMATGCDLCYFFIFIFLRAQDGLNVTCMKRTLFYTQMQAQLSMHNYINSVAPWQPKSGFKWRKN